MELPADIIKMIILLGDFMIFTSFPSVYEEIYRSTRGENPIKI